jgi:hypothetical protein
MSLIYRVKEDILHGYSNIYLDIVLLNILFLTLTLIVSISFYILTVATSLFIF